MAFVDSSFWIGYIRARDQHHFRSLELIPEIRSLDKIYVTSGIVHEVVNHLFKSESKQKASEFLNFFSTSVNVEIIFLNDKLWENTIAYFTQYNFSLTDAQIVSAMEEKGEHQLYSFDRGFDQVHWLERIH